MLHDALGLQQVQHRIGAVGAVIGVDEEIVKPDGAVIGDPFQNERAFILHRRHDDPAAATIADGLWLHFRHPHRVVTEDVLRQVQKRRMFDQRGFGHDLRDGPGRMPEGHAAIEMTGAGRVRYRIADPHQPPDGLFRRFGGGDAPTLTGASAVELHADMIGEPDRILVAHPPRIGMATQKRDQTAICGNRAVEHVRLVRHQADQTRRYWRPRGPGPAAAFGQSRKTAAPKGVRSRVRPAGCPCGPCRARRGRRRDAPLAADRGGQAAGQKSSRTTVQSKSARARPLPKALVNASSDPGFVRSRITAAVMP